MMRRFCMSGVKRHSGTWPTSFQVTCLRSPNMASGAVERACALRRKALNAGTALHQHDAEDFLELLEAGRHGRLGNAAGLGGPAEMPLFCERQQKFKLVDQGEASAILL